MNTQLEKEFNQFLAKERAIPLDRRMTLACGKREHSFLWDLAMEAMDHFPGLDITVVIIPSKDTTATREEISGCLCFDDLGEELLLLDNLLDNLLDSDEFLEQLEFDLEIKVNKTPCSGKELLFALIGKENI